MHFIGVHAAQNENQPRLVLQVLADPGKDLLTVAGGEHEVESKDHYRLEVAAGDESLERLEEPSAIAWCEALHCGIDESCRSA